ncbi:uncharacterized protein [Typha latifolia]|uniref:uncharacterized protein n=1 Tax=Typha latifolia TaxID=4733 RepID=UPI003C2C4C61
MNSAASAASSPALLPLHRHLRRRIPTLPISSSLFRRRPNNRSPSQDRRLGSSLPLERLRRLADAADEAFRDLRKSYRVERGDLIVFSCRRSSLVFVGNLLLWSFAAVIAVRVLVWIGLGFRWRRWGFGEWAAVRRRDRSLGGREVVVGRRKSEGLKVSVNPLSPARGSFAGNGKNAVEKRGRRREELPKWWPELSPSPSPSPAVDVQREELQREANRLVRAIMDNRMSGKDYRYDDMIQLRELCRLSGGKISFETANARDSFYRAAIDSVLEICSRATQTTDKVQINGEDVRTFISALADNIGLPSFRAATLIRAAVAARTRASFLQSWALEAQGKRSEALAELLKIGVIHQIFPPEEQSPEMEMVASGIKKNLQADQRKHLLTLYRGVCGAANCTTVAEALDLRS